MSDSIPHNLEKKLSFSLKIAAACLVVSGIVGLLLPLIRLGPHFAEFEAHALAFKIGAYAREIIFAILFVVAGCGIFFRKPWARIMALVLIPLSAIYDANSCAWCIARGNPPVKTRIIAAVTLFLVNSIWFYLIYRAKSAPHSQKSADVPQPPQQELPAAIPSGQLETSEAVGSALSQDPQTPKPPPELPIEFSGSARGYFRIWIVNLCLTLLTLGIFSAWAKVRRKRYSYSHTTLGGTPFQYLGRPIQILKGRLIAAAGFLVYYISGHFFTSLLPYVLGAGLVAAPWVIIRSAAFNARYSAFRNMTFHFDGRYLQAMKVLYGWIVIPALLGVPVVVIGMMYGWASFPKPVVAGITGAAVLVLLVLFPWWMRRFKNFIIEHTSFGGKTGAFSAKGGQFFKYYLLAVLIVLAALISWGTVVGALSKSGLKNWLFPYLFMVPFYGGCVVAFAYVRSRSGNLVWNHSVLGPVRFESTLRCRELLKLYVTNALGIIASLGLLIPWAVMRTMKYRADTMRVLLEGELTEFEGSDLSAVAAAGVETADLFDLDFSL